MSEDLEKKVDEFLQHYGVVGMKWGVRKSLSGKIKPRVTLNYLDRAELKWTEKAMTRTYSQVYRKAQFKIRKGVRLLNDNPKYKDQNFKKDSPLRREYYAEYSKMVSDQLNAAVGRTRLLFPIMKIGQSPFRRLELNFEFDMEKESQPRAFIRRRDTSLGNKENNLIKKEVRKFQHSNTSDMDDEIEVIMQYDENGYILDFEIPNTNMAHFASVDAEDFLIHWGILGMKWGVRKDRRFSKSNRKFKTDDEKRIERTKEEPVEIPKPKTYKDLSDEELKRLVNRLNLESQYVKMMPKSTQQKVTDFITSQLINFGKTTVEVYVKRQAVKAATGLLTDIIPSKPTPPPPNKKE